MSYCFCMTLKCTGQTVQSLFFMQVTQFFTKYQCRAKKIWQIVPWKKKSRANQCNALNAPSVKWWWNRVIKQQFNFCVPCDWELWTIFVNLLGQGKDLWIYGQYTQIAKYIHYALLMMSQKESPRNHPWPGCFLKELPVWCEFLILG